MMQLVEAGVTRTATNRQVALADALRASNVRWIGQRFQEVFLDEVVEISLGEPIAGYDLKGSQDDRIFDRHILWSLGDYALVNLGHICDLVARQIVGDDGFLLVQGGGNITYARDKNDIMRAVYLFWYSNHFGWGIETFELERSLGWSSGHRVLAYTY